MATNTYVAIESQTTTSTVASITLGSGGTIPQTYTDLVLVVSGKSSGIYNWGLRFNGDTGTNYSRTLIYGNGSSAASTRQTSANNANPGFLTSEGSRTTIQIMDYSNTTTNKSFLTRGGDFSDSVSLGVGMWRPSNLATGNITSITLFSDGGSYISAGSTFTLYGIANTTKLAPKALGGIITQDDTYTYHAFRASGTFTPTQSLTADCLVVAGGGGGGATRGGGGGAGGLTYYSSQSLTATGYTVTVGGPGAASATTNAQGGSGSNSQFASLTASVGGGGGGSGYTLNHNGLSGGSGGGAGKTGSGGSATSGQGNAGGTAVFDNAGGGGGGFAGAGSNGVGAVGGTGGLATNTYSSWLSATGLGVSGYIAGGGGGGAGGSPAGEPAGSTTGGGGAGGTVATGYAGVANTGSGGGGAGDGLYLGGAGGSGVVIIKYLTA